MALMLAVPGDRTAPQVGGLPVFAFTVRQSEAPPPSRVLGLLGSRMKGAMKFAFELEPASVRPLTM
jgi:hypothetical protein